ncbi:MAG: hypothetical protein K8H99_02950 [Nitrospirae bacterium]|nr:hypothetical protein [Fimbriimonadaceae bacterium]
MSKTFKQAVKVACKLPEQDHEALGAILIREIESDGRWSALFKESQDLLAKLADEALEQHRGGKATPWA